MAPRLAGAANPFTAEQQGAQALLAQARAGFVPLAGYPDGGIYIQPPDDARAGEGPLVATRPQRAVPGRIPPERRPLLFLALLVLLGSGGVLLTRPHGAPATARTPQVARPLGQTARPGGTAPAGPTALSRD